MRRCVVSTKRIEFDRAEHCRRIAAKGGKTTAARHGRGYMREIGRKGWLVTTARYFLGSERLHAAWLAAMGAHVYWRESGLEMKLDGDGRPVWPEEAPVHPAARTARGQRGLFEGRALAELEGLPF
jgi:general stress protein YciG